MTKAARYRRIGSTNHWIGLVLGLSLGIAACQGQSVSPKATAGSAAPKTAIRWSQTAAPQGVDVPGAEWLKIEGAGGRSTNVQVAAVLRPPGPGPFPVVVYFHGGPGFAVADVTGAARLTASGLVVLVGCWRFTSTEAIVFQGVSYPSVPCPRLQAGPDDAARALIEVGPQLPDVKKDAIGLFGIGMGADPALQYIATSTGVRGAVVDGLFQSGPSKLNAPVLLLGGTADAVFPIQQLRDYEQALRNSGSTVEAYYYQGGGHVVTVFGDFQEDAIKRTIEFFRRHLK
jgi:dienelactone hydrolase